MKSLLIAGLILLAPVALSGTALADCDALGLTCATPHITRDYNFQYYHYYGYGEGTAVTTSGMSVHYALSNAGAITCGKSGIGSLSCTTPTIHDTTQWSIPTCHTGTATVRGTLSHADSISTDCDWAALVLIATLQEVAHDAQCAASPEPPEDCS